MFIFLSKFLPLLIYPLGVIFLLIILALLTRNKPKWQAVCLGLALILLLLSSNRWVALSLSPTPWSAAERWMNPSLRSIMALAPRSRSH